MSKSKVLSRSRKKSKKPGPEIQVDQPKEINPEDELIADIAGFSNDPLGFVHYSFEWGKGDLLDHPGPDDWQTEILSAIGNGILTPNEAIQIAIASGHGIGKSALVAWIILWALSTYEDTRGIVTANTATQLQTKTWPELAKWHNLYIARHWFVYTATSIYSAQKDHEKTWRFDMIPWSENNTEAFAGLHNKGKRVVLLFDEASAIPDKIWEVAEGAMTDKDTEIIWCCFGNPTRNDGRFHACFNTLKHRWIHKQIDSRRSSISNKEQIEKWIEDYGIDSDFIKVRVKGEFPDASELQYIPASYAAQARRVVLKPEQYDFAPIIIGVDNCWTGSDEGCIYLRQGLWSEVLATFKKNDNDLEIAGHVARFEDERKADGVCIDLGYGTGIYSAGQQMGRGWFLIPFGSSSPKEGFANMRAYMWGQVKAWLKEGGKIPDLPQLQTELTGPEAYVKTVGKNAGRIILESKEDMKKRGLASPNMADALALTFSMDILPKLQQLKGDTYKAKSDWDPFKEDD